jgi:hypothetical protein
LRRSACGWLKYPIGDDPRFEPGFDDLSDGGIGVEFGKECLMADVVEASFDIRI